MSKSHKDFVIFTRNGVDINALVVFSQDVITPATQFEPATNVEHLTLVYLDPSAASSRPTGDQIRNSMKLEFSVPPLTEGKVNGWKDVVSTEVEQVKPTIDGSGTERYGSKDWTQEGQDATGFPVEKGSASDVTASTEGFVDPAGVDGRSIHPDFVPTDPEAYHAFLNGREGTPETAAEYEQVLKENADHAHNHPLADDGQTPSGHGPNPALPGTDPSQIDNPAPASPKDDAIEQGDVVGEAV